MHAACARAGAQVRCLQTGFAPLAIGFAIGFLSFIGGSTSGGVFNPARLFGPGADTLHVLERCGRVTH
jgi:glycerol uptake facilitator-like aquaporin